LSLPWHFFVVNDGKKPSPLTTQNMCCLVYHSIYQTCSDGNTTKKQKGMISYNQQHGYHDPSLGLTIKTKAWKGAG